VARLSDEEIREGLAGLDGWERDGEAIRKEFTFAGFRAAIAFIDRLAEVAIASRHHPDLENHYNRVVVSLTSHDAGGVTPADLSLARGIEAVAAPPEPAGA
jgi:4a-hydroxytetrahydrobiopterin dehydratase